MSRDAGSASPSNSYDINSVASGFTNDTSDGLVSLGLRSSVLAQRLRLSLIAVSHTVGIKEDRCVAPSATTSNQLEYLSKVIKAAIAHPSSFYFKLPVDPVALNIPDYINIIQRPMDLKTIQTRLQKRLYASGHECICDLNQLFTNCYIFNPSHDVVTGHAFQLETFISEKLHRLPWPEQFTQAKLTGPQKKRGPQKGLARDSPSKMARLTTDESLAHLDLTPQIRSCLAVLKELKTKHPQLTIIFMEPVDAEKLKLMDYHDIVKHPMDMQTMWNKAISGQYTHPAQFDADFKLMIDNCITYNGKVSYFGKEATKLLSIYLQTYRRLVLDEAGPSEAPPIPPAPPTVPKASSTNVAVPPRPSVPNLKPPVMTSSSPAPPSQPPPTVSTHSTQNNVFPQVHPAPLPAQMDQRPPVSGPSLLPPTLPPQPGHEVQPPHFTDDETEDLERIYADLATMSEKSLELAFLVDEIQSRINQLCDRRPTTFAGLQKYLTVRGFDRLPEFFAQPLKFLEPYDSGTASMTRRSVAPQRPSATGPVLVNGSMSGGAGQQEVTKRNKSHHKVPAATYPPVVSSTPVRRPSPPLMVNGSVTDQDSRNDSRHSGPVLPALDRPVYLASQSNASHNSSTKPPSPAAINKEVTFEEKEQLSRSIHGMSQVHLAKVVDIIQQFERSPRRDPTTNDIEVDFDSLHTATLRALQKYVAEIGQSRPEAPAHLVSNSHGDPDRYRHMSGSSSGSETNSTYSSDSSSSSRHA